jgi:hypothetical protein
MTDFLTRLASRALGQTPVLEPLLDSWRAAADYVAWPGLPVLGLDDGAADEPLPSTATPVARRARALGPPTLEGPSASTVDDAEPARALAPRTDTAALAYESVAPPSQHVLGSDALRFAARTAAPDGPPPDAAARAPLPDTSARRPNVTARVRTLAPALTLQPTATGPRAHIAAAPSEAAEHDAALEAMVPPPAIAPRMSASASGGAELPPQTVAARNPTAPAPRQPPTRTHSSAPESTAEHTPHETRALAAPPSSASTRPNARPRRMPEPRTISVTIGRIEVRAAPPAPPVPPSPVVAPSRAPRLSLDAYLTERNGAHR